MKDKSIFIKNIYYMLSYAFTALDQGGYEDIEKESFDHIHNLFAAILAKGIGRQLKQGLYREYISRIRFSKQRSCFCFVMRMWSRDIRTI